eukprot:CAMPEP_0197928082 /NCGR_PEP_ID=MMETSP1439-20131203/101735_1 /TAXON_ID=66791 /ORGANISM="Gonyaulax spinifera, Strain CCMP409" /LENGTH=70 /DNA_ID=CAMNT_0043550673 /DNA_START=88 /DNA_END=297 /DNA_ORIENTATION=-
MSVTAGRSATATAPALAVDACSTPQASPLGGCTHVIGRARRARPALKNLCRVAASRGRGPASPRRVLWPA